MKIFISKPLRDLSFQRLFEKILFWKKEDDPLIEKLTNICMFGFDYVEPERKNSFISFQEFTDHYIPSKRTKIQKLLDKYNSINKQINYIKINEHDLWNLDETLSKIIAPALIALKEDKYGYPLVDDEDVPEELKTKSEDVQENFSISKWEYVLNEMIFAFSNDQWELIEDTKEEKIKKERIKNGFRLFGKYYQCLWT